MKTNRVYILKAVTVDFEDVSFAFELEYFDTIRDAKAKLSDMHFKTSMILGFETNLKFKVKCEYSPEKMKIDNASLAIQQQLNTSLGVSGKQIRLWIEKQKSAIETPKALDQFSDSYQDFEIAA